MSDLIDYSEIMRLVYELEDTGGRCREVRTIRDLVDRLKAADEVVALAQKLTICPANQVMHWEHIFKEALAKYNGEGDE